MDSDEQEAPPPLPSQALTVKFLSACFLSQFPKPLRSHGVDSSSAAFILWSSVDDKPMSLGWSGPGCPEGTCRRQRRTHRASESGRVRWPLSALRTRISDDACSASAASAARVAALREGATVAVAATAEAFGPGVPRRVLDLVMGKACSQNKQEDEGKTNAGLQQ